MSIAIRRYCADDVARLYDAVRESISELAPFMWWCHDAYAIDDARLWVEQRAIDFEAGTSFDFVIASDEHPFLGVCGLSAIDRINQRANLGYWIRSSAAGRGVATAATRLLARWAFENTELIRLEIIVSLKNAGSLRVAEKAGAKREGVLRKRLLLHGQSHDAAIFSIVRGEMIDERLP